MLYGTMAVIILVAHKENYLAKLPQPLEVLVQL